MGTGRAMTGGEWRVPLVVFAMMIYPFVCSYVGGGEGGLSGSCPFVKAK